MVVYRGRRQTTWPRGAETGTCSPCSRNHSSVCRAEPSSKNLLNTSSTRSCTRRSGSFSRCSSPLTYPAGDATISSPRFAFSRRASTERCRSRSIHIRSNCPSTLTIGDHCFAAACTPSLDQSIACRQPDRLLLASAIPDYSVQSATLLSPLPHPHGPSRLPPPFVRSPLWPLYLMRIGRDPHRQLRCHASRGYTIDPA